MARIVTLGEIMLRLKSPALERFFQSPSLEATFGGGEANVAVSLANYGMDAAFVTALPNNAIGEACLRDVRSFGVDVSNIKMRDGRMGIYFLETGSNQRPSKVVYDVRIPASPRLRSIPSIGRRSSTARPGSTSPASPRPSPSPLRISLWLPSRLLRRWA